MPASTQSPASTQASPAADAMPGDRSNTARQLKLETPQTAQAPQAELAFSVRLTTANTDAQTESIVPESGDPAAQPVQPANAAVTSTNPQAATQANTQYIASGQTGSDETAPVEALPEAAVAAPVNKKTDANVPQSTRTSVSTDSPARSSSSDREDAPTPVSRVSATGAADDFTRAFGNMQPVNVETSGAANIESDTKAPFHSVAEALRTSEPQIEASNTPAATPLQGITIRVAQPDALPVDLHVTERGGEIHVAVRTADAGMQTAMRQDLGTLTNSLERAWLSGRDLCSP